MNVDDPSTRQSAELRNLDRRRFLEGAFACLSGLAVPAAVASSMDTGGAVQWRTPMPDTRAAAAAGRLYLEQHPQEASAAWLEQCLFGRELSLHGGHSERDDLMDRLQQGRRRDFGDGNLVVLNGWYFARTEARLLALISLRPS